MDALRTAVPSTTLTCPPPTSKSHAHTHTLSSSLPIVQSTSTTNRLWWPMSPNKHDDVYHSQVDYCCLCDRHSDGHQDRLIPELKSVYSCNRRNLPHCSSPHLETLSHTAPLDFNPPSPIEQVLSVLSFYYGTHCSVRYSNLLLENYWRSP